MHELPQLIWGKLHQIMLEPRARIFKALRTRDTTPSKVIHIRIIRTIATTKIKAEKEVEVHKEEVAEEAIQGQYIKYMTELVVLL